MLRLRTNKGLIWRDLRQRFFIMGAKNNLSLGFLLVAKAKISFLYKIQYKSPTFFGLKIGWKKNLERLFSDENSSITLSISTLLT